ncbi:MAG: GGDEF domain-containing protein [Leptospirales bacterium]
MNIDKLHDRLGDLFFSSPEPGKTHSHAIQYDTARFTNFVITLTTFWVGVYLLLYLTVFKSNAAAIVNVSTILSLLTVLLINKKGHVLTARTLLITIMMTQFFILTTFILSNKSGIHLFYICIPPVCVLIWNYRIKKQRYLILLFSALSVFLLLGCEFTQTPLVKIPLENFQYLYSFSVVVIIGTMFLIVGYFSISITKATDTLQKLAATDTLTGVSNRRVFMETGERLLAEALRYNRDFTIMILDIDKFKSINDIYGHPVGDEIIKLTAKASVSFLRETDTFARIGGEEFAILLPETNSEQAIKVAEKLRTGIENLIFITQMKETIRHTISIGVTSFGKEIKNLDDLISKCDGALYRAKKSGRNKCVVF